MGKNILTIEMAKLVPSALRNFDLEWASKNIEWHVSTYWFARQDRLLCRLTSRIRAAVRVNRDHRDTGLHVCPLHRDNVGVLATSAQSHERGRIISQMYQQVRLNGRATRCSRLRDLQNALVQFKVERQWPLCGESIDRLG